MKKISIKKIIEFRSKSEKTKKNFVTSLKQDKIKSNSDGGGDYWVSCLSAISNSFRKNNLDLIVDKKNELIEKRDETDYNRTKQMFNQNIFILSKYEDINFEKWWPSKKITFIKKKSEYSKLFLKGLEIEVKPHHVFTFEKNDVIEIGAIWFIAKKNGFKKDELGMFADGLFKYLKANYSKEYIVNSRYCIAVDVFNNIDVNYSLLESGKIPNLLNATIDDIKRLV